ncbi:MAG TPA: hypothetical protein VK859_15545, partial [bacterium]|nr:hypothetical protein [bacterium]
APTPSVTATLTSTATPTITNTQANTATPTPTATPSSTATATPTATTCGFQLVSTFGSLGTGLGQFEFPDDVAVDPSGNIYVVDSTGRITEWSGPPTAPTAVTSWNITAAGTGPYHLTADSQYLYVSTSTGFQIFNIPSGTSHDSGSSSPVSFWGIGEDGSGNLYVADNSHDRVFIFSPSTYSQSLFANTGTPSLGVAVDSQTNVYVSDSLGNVQKYNSAGTAQPLVTTAGTGPGQTGGTVYDLAVDGCNRLFVDDSINGRALVFGPGGSPYLTSVNYGSAGVTVFGIGTDKNGDLYVPLSTSDVVEVFAPQACLACNPPTATASPTPSPVMTVTSTATQTATSSATLTPTNSPTTTASFTASPTATLTPTLTLTNTPTNSPSNTSTLTPTPSPTATPTLTLTATASKTPTATLTNSATPTATFTATSSPTSGVACGTSSVDLQLEEFTTCMANQSNETFEVINAGTSAVNLNQITIKFWVDDTTGQAVVGAVNYGGCFGSTCTAVTGTSISAVNFSPACGPDGNNQANWETTVSTTDTAALGAGVTWTNLQTAIHLANFANFSNDSIWYSPCGIGGGTAYTNDLHYAVYYQGNLVTASGGVPPSCRPNPTCTPTPPAGAVKPSAERGEGTPTSTPTASPTVDKGPAPLVVAAPNISRSGEPVQFLVTLARPSEVKLTLFSLSGEKVYQISIQGGNGLHRIPWNLTNQVNAPVASGLYIYLLETNDGVSALSQEGKVAVLH